MSELEERINNIIASNLVRLLKVRNRTQLELAEYLGVTQATISNWCNGIKMPRMDKIDLICKFFDIRRSQLMDEPSSSSDSQAAVPLDPGEERLLYLYRGLNSVGQTKLNEYAEDLSANKKYQLRVHDVVSESSPTYGINIDNSDLPMVAETQAKYGDEAI